MSVFKKINKETGDEELRYIAYEGDDKALYNDVSTFNMSDCVLGDWGYSIFVKNECLIIIHFDAVEVVFCTPITVGDIIMPFYFHYHNEEDHTLKFDKSRTYTPDELEELYPSHLYDTVEVLG